MVLTSRVKLSSTLAIALSAATLVVPTATAATPVRLTGSIAGEVRTAAGVGQMGASIVLLNRYDRVLRQTLSNENGAFIFDSLVPDLYSVRVTMSSFVPALKKGISVQPGFQSMLTINLAGVLSSIELVYSSPITSGLMTDDWKWVLRSSQATRPVLRFRDVIYRDPVKDASTASVFSETRGLLRVSGGDGPSGAGMQPDLGTAFALATSLFGTNELQLSGAVGYSAQAGVPTAGFRTTYSRNGGDISSPEVTVTVRQISLPTRGGFGPAGGQSAGPALRTAAASYFDRTRISDNITVEYGMTLESVSMLDRLNTITPFARLNYDLGTSGLIQFAYSSGAPPAELAHRSVEGASERDQSLSHDISALAALPLVSMREGRARVQRTSSMEASYKKTAGSRTYSFGAYREHLRDAILTLGGESEFFDRGDLLADVASNSSVFNAGDFERWGYMASVTQSIFDTLDVALAYGRGGALALGHGRMDTPSAAELRSALTMGHRNWATARISGTLPVVGTRFATSYGWMDSGSISPARLSLAETNGPEPGVNLFLRQPVPTGGLLPGRIEAVGEVRNMMAQGYLPVISASGRPAVLTNSPRSLRGGLSFIF